MPTNCTPRAWLALSASFALTLVVAGCGGGATDTSDAVVVPEPGTSVASSAPTAPANTTTAAAPAAGSPAATAPAATPVKAEGWGTLKGQITLNGTAPAMPDLAEKGKASKDPDVCAKDAPIKSERLEVDAATKGVKNVIVYLPKPTAVNDEAKSAAAKADVVFDQDKCIFEPHVLAIMAGAKITLKSSDPVNHNVNARLKNSPFNSLLSAGSTQPFSPAAAERAPAPVTCDIHPWMLAYWLVLDNPYFSVTNDKGEYEIKNVPAGTQKVVVWQEATGFVTAPSGEDINITAGDPTTKAFTVDASKVKPSK